MKDLEFNKDEPKETKLENIELVSDAVFDGGFELIAEIAVELISGMGDGL